MATSTNPFDGLNGRFTLIPLNINSIEEKKPDNGELLADFTTGEISLAVVNELSGEIIAVLNPFKTLRKEVQDQITTLIDRVNDADAVQEVTAILIEEIQGNFDTTITKVREDLSSLGKSARTQLSNIAVMAASGEA